MGKIFFLDTGEGKDFINPVTGWYIEDLSGWLIEDIDEEEFIRLANEGKHRMAFENQYVFAIWTRDGNGEIGVNFNSADL